MVFEPKNTYEMWLLSLRTCDLNGKKRMICTFWDLYVWHVRAQWMFAQKRDLNGKNRMICTCWGLWKGHWERHLHVKTRINCKIERHLHVKSTYKLQNRTPLTRKSTYKLEKLAYAPKMCKNMWTMHLYIKTRLNSVKTRLNSICWRFYLKLLWGLLASLTRKNKYKRHILCLF